MSPATSTQVRRRTAARREALARQYTLNEERRRRDEQEIDYAAEFAMLAEQRAVAQAAVIKSEQAMGAVVDRLVGELGIRYARAAQLVDTTEDELKRLRQLAADATESQPRTGARSRRLPTKRGDTARATPATAVPPAQPVVADAQTPRDAADNPGNSDADPTG